MTNPVARIKAKVDHRNLHNWGWWPARETVAHLRVTSTNAPNEGQMVSNRQRNGTNSTFSVTHTAEWIAFRFCAVQTRATVLATGIYVFQI